MRIAEEQERAHETLRERQVADGTILRRVQDDVDRIRNGKK